MMEVAEYHDAGWIIALNRWRSIVEKFESAYMDLQQVRPEAMLAGKLAQWAELDRQALSMRAAVMQIAKPMASVYGWMTSMAQGMANLRDIADELGMPMVPEIPYYVINGSSAAVVMLTLKMRNFIENVKE